MDEFIRTNAVNSKRSITFNDINVPVSDKGKLYLINNFIKDGYIVKMDDNTLWFDKKKWDEAEKSITKIYMMILILPIVITTVLVFIINNLK